ncbi:MAG: DUF4402 domain-containing protein [Chlorobiaceae bacterium]|jgi:hypothetical protein|nr:DUF4402 domain-containing protein [Chlorobiaceae bacterium]
MKKKILALSCLAALFAFGSDAQAIVVGDNGTATATIAGAISVAKYETGSTTGGDLAFGNIIAGPSAGTVTINPFGSGARSFTTVTGTNLLPFGPAQFKVTGDANANYTVSLPSSDITIYSGTNTMTVDAFTKTVTTGTLTGGSDVFRVGGTLHVGANQPSGTYSGTFNVTAAYN